MSLPDMYKLYPSIKNSNPNPPMVKKHNKGTTMTMMMAMTRAEGSSQGRQEPE